MKAEPQRVVNGVINYADNEIINSLPTTGKWLVGAGLGIMTAKMNELIDSLVSNPMIKMMGIVDDEGLFDVDLIMDNLKGSANKYGKMTVQIPLVGNLTFNENDIDSLRNYIERG